MSTQPNALRLAVKLHCGDDKCKCTLNLAAEELRAQHELIQTLKAALLEVNASIYMDDSGYLRLTRSFDESMLSSALAAAEAHK